MLGCWDAGCFLLFSDRVLAVAFALLLLWPPGLFAEIKLLDWLSPYARSGSPLSILPSEKVSTQREKLGGRTIFYLSLIRNITQLAYISKNINNSL